MSGIHIPKEQMPENCKECRVKPATYRCINREVLDPGKMDKRQSFCPLIAKEDEA